MERLGSQGGADRDTSPSQQSSSRKAQPWCVVSSAERDKGFEKHHGAGCVCVASKNETRRTQRLSGLEASADLSENRVKALGEGLTWRRSGSGEVDGFFRAGAA